MSLLFESIACQDGHLQNLYFHQERVNRSRFDLLGLSEQLLIESISIPASARVGLWKCRVSYAEEINKVVFTKYTPTNPSNFKVIEADIEYANKLENRTKLNELFGRRGEADDIVIVVNGLITDSSYGNLLFYNGIKWLTPAKPLLKGTMRASLLARAIVFEEDIYLQELKYYERFMMINALNPFDQKRALPISSIT